MKSRPSTLAVSAYDWYCTATLLLCCRDRLTDWEHDWLKRLKQQEFITDRQLAVLKAIERTARDGPDIPPGTSPAVLDGVPGLVHHSRMLSNGRSDTPHFTPCKGLPKSIRVLVTEKLRQRGRK